MVPFHLLPELCLLRLHPPGVEPLQPGADGIAQRMEVRLLLLEGRGVVFDKVPLEVDGVLEVLLNLSVRARVVAVELGCPDGNLPVGRRRQACGELETFLLGELYRIALERGAWPVWHRIDLTDRPMSSGKL